MGKVGWGSLQNLAMTMYHLAVSLGGWGGLCSFNGCCGKILCPKQLQREGLFYSLRLQGESPGQESEAAGYIVSTAKQQRIRAEVTLWVGSLSPFHTVQDLPRE